jgi:hypothetical protein
MTVSLLRAARITGLGLIFATALCQCDQLKHFTGSEPVKPGPYAYDLTLQLTPAAEAKLKASDRHFTVDAYYYGKAKPENRAKADELNRLDLGYDKQAFSGQSRHLQMTGEGIDPKLLVQVLDGEPYVMATIRTATKAGFPDELLSCHTYVGTIRDARRLPPVVICDTQY